MKAMILGLAALMSIPLIGPALAEERARAAMATPAERSYHQPGYVDFNELGDIDPSELSGLLEHVDVDVDLEL
ncbi:MAG: hypothetical protein V2I82_05655 [Halieaceae bacterium]|jgi:hypothetical protein|nr:hypothetical protein [Halieaceae bacterium]